MILISGALGLFERELALELAILQEKNRSIDLQNKQIESKETTERKKIELDNQIAQRNLDFQNKRFDAEQKQAKKDALIQAQKENAAKHKAETTALHKRINAFIEKFYEEIDEDGDIVIDEDDCKDLSKAAKKLYSEMEVLFSEVDINDTLHGKALALIAKDLSPRKLNGDLKLDYPDHEIKLFRDCLTKGVILGDSENNFDSEEDDEY